VLAEACRAMARWRARGVAVPKVSINVSVSQLDRLDLLPQLSALLAETGVPASCIELELTESVIMNADNALAKLEALRALGVSLAIDDFGTGYSSLSYLRHLPVQKIKIDRSFFVDMEQHDDAAAVVRGIVGLANSLALETVAEGVETQDQLDFLIGEGCHIVQGYIFGPPLDEADVATFRVDFAA
jgi:EAL domain-containing protein (putative c-di-GMP-specific phosphodiesterase class I)